ncbi:integral membrane protein [Bacillus mycoides]|uniref:hypothetical protein n=1 Tax=Bacillus mycoides TaxID=1405 RepID=UPI0007AB3225|nr:hypothetical protein [Bacillus mycoides]KZE06700.1 integral membrane protein [Bacillus mycoides]SCC63217.1 Integral memebrane protein [Bacillus mycoides]
MIKIKKFIGTISGLIMIFCVILSVKIGNELYIGDYFFSLVNLNHTKIVVILAFFVCYLICSKTLKGIESIALNWLRVTLSGLMFVAFLSYCIM